MSRFQRERVIDIAYLFLAPSGLLILMVLAFAGYYSGSHPVGYVTMTETFLASAAIVLPLLRVTKKFITPYWFILSITGLVYLHGFGLYLGAYIAWENWDVLAHISASIIVTMIVFIGMLVVKEYTTVIELGKVMFLLMVFVIGFGFGNFWEIVEWFIDNAFGYTYMSYSIHDTLRDIVTDLIGAGIMTLAAAYFLRIRTPFEILSGFGLHNFMTSMGKKWDRKCEPRTLTEDP